jgi:PAS domain S-box-containing protein
MQRKATNENSEIQELRAQLEEAQETLNAIRRGEVDGLVVSTPKGEQVYTITGAERPYRILIEKMHEGAVMLSDDNTILYCNNGFANIMKSPLENIVGKNIENMVSPTFKVSFKGFLAQCRVVAQKEVTLKEPWTAGITFQADDHSLVPTQVSANSLSLDNTTTTFIVVTDLTNHMAAELKQYTTDLEKTGSALYESEQRWSTTLSSIGDAVIATDMNGKVTFMNNIAEKLTGWSLADANQERVQKVFKIISEATRKTVEDPVSKVLEKGLIVGLANHTILVRRDGSEIQIDDSGAPIKDKNGKIVGTVLIFRDITQRRQREAQEKMQNAVQSGITKIFQEVLHTRSERDLGQLCLSVAEEITQSKFGFIAELNSQGLQDIAVSNTGQEFRKTLGNNLQDISMQVLKEGKPLFINNLSTNTNNAGLQEGHLPIKSLLSVPLKNDGKTIGMIAVGNREDGYTDSQLELLEGLTAAIVEALMRKRAEEKLDAYRMNLEKLVEERTRELQAKERLAAIGTTASMVGHDIRNPLQSIVSELFLARQELETMPESAERDSVKESMQLIEEQTFYINKIVADLQDYTKPLTPKPQKVILASVVKESLSSVVIPPNITVNLNLRDGTEINADQLYLKRVFVNLISNALQAMPHGGKLTLGIDFTDGYACITVRDTGLGIPEDVKSKIFQPLFTTKAKGQGLGLAVVKRLTEALNGTVTFESVVGDGSTFTVKLPVNTQKPS